MFQPGIAAVSAENAYQVREALVSPAAPQNSCPTMGDQDHQLCGPRVQGALEDTRRPSPAPSLTAFHVGGREQEPEQDEPTDQGGEENRAPDALGGLMAAPWVSSAVWADAS